MRIKFKRLNGQTKLLKSANTGLECFNKCIGGMVFARHCHKVFRTVIASYSIKVMPDFIRFQRSSQLLFQYKAVFQHTLAIRKKNSDIAVPATKVSTTLPSRMSLTLSGFRPALVAHLRLTAFLTATARAFIIFRRASLILKHITLGTSQSTFGTKLKIPCTCLKRLTTISTYQISHTISITHYIRGVNYGTTAF